MSSQSVLIIDCYMEPPGATSNFSRYVKGLAWESYLPAHGQAAKHPFSEYRGIIITGSAASVTDRLGWVEDLVPQLNGALVHEVPILGVCFGHQLLAHVLGGEIGKAKKPELGTVSIEWRSPMPLLEGLEPSFSCFVSHEDEVVELGLGCEAVAHSAGCRIQAFRHRQYPAWGIQFHPEMPESEALDLLKWRAERHPELSIDVEALHAQRVNQRDLAEHIFSGFLNFCR
jgi:GMP synthase (glutamine-hydrolysing)